MISNNNNNTSFSTTSTTTFTKQNRFNQHWLIIKTLRVEKGYHYFKKNLLKLNPMIEATNDGWNKIGFASHLEVYQQFLAIQEKQSFEKASLVSKQCHQVLENCIANEKVLVIRLGFDNFVCFPLFNGKKVLSSDKSKWIRQFEFKFIENCKNSNNNDNEKDNDSFVQEKKEINILNQENWLNEMNIRHSEGKKFFS